MSLTQVQIESGFFRILHLLLGTGAGERDCLDVSFSPRLCGYFVTASIGQTEGITSEAIKELWW
jgi:hypothetical protein